MQALRSKPASRFHAQHKYIRADKLKPPEGLAEAVARMHEFDTTETLDFPRDDLPTLIEAARMLLEVNKWVVS